MIYTSLEYNSFTLHTVFTLQNVSFFKKILKMRLFNFQVMQIPVILLYMLPKTIFNVFKLFLKIKVLCWLLF